MKKILKNYSFKCIACLLSFLMVFYVFPVSVWADIITSNELILDDSVSIGDSPSIIEIADMREERVKHFKLEDGTYIAAQYDIPIHYLNEEGTWSDIDNTLNEEGITSLGDMSGYAVENKAKVKFANNTNSSKTLSIKYGNYKISFGLIDANKSKRAVISNPDVVDDSVQGYEHLSTLSKLVSKVKYEEAYDNVDVEYVLIGNDIKENIIIKKGEADSYSFSYEMKLNKLDATLNDDGSIILCDSNTGEAIYIIPAPYMYDENSAYSDAVSYTLTKKGNKYTVTVTAATEWINSPERVFPVTVDPTITYNTAGTGVLSTYVSSGNPTQSYTNTYNYVGYSSGFINEHMRLYIKPKSIPTLPSHAVLNYAKISMKQSSYSGSASGVEVGAFPVTSSWSYSLPSIVGLNYGNITWNSQPTYSTQPIAINLLSSDTNNTYVTWDITKLAKQWYDGSLANQGVVLINMNEDSPTNAYAQFYSGYPSQGAALNPSISISYSIVKGLESYYSYYETSADMAGTGYVNAFNGELTFIHDSFSTADDILPYTFGLVYNGYMANQYYSSSTAQVSFAESYMGKGFKLSADETIIKEVLNGHTYYIWSDSDGTEHYFSYDSSYQAYCDESGLQLTIRENSDGSFTICDDFGNCKNFDSTGYLSSIVDIYGNQRTFLRDSAANNRLQRTTLTPNGYGTISQMYFTYNASNKLSTILNNQTQVKAYFYYSDTYNGEISDSGAGYLRQIKYVYPDSTTTDETDNPIYLITFDYDTSGRIVLVKDLKTQIAVMYSYSETTGEINEIRQFPNATETSTINNLINEATNTPTYVIAIGEGESRITDPGTDLTFGTEDDIISVDTFDQSGRPVSTYTMQNGVILSSQSITYDDSNVKTKNKPKIAGAMQGASSNYLQDPGFENQEYGNWVSTGYGRYSSESGGMNNSNGSYYSLTIYSSIPESSVYCMEYLDPGTYTFSVLLNMYDMDEDAEAKIQVMAGSTIVASRTLSPYTSMSNSWKREGITFTVNTRTQYKFVIQLTNATASGNAYASLYIDSAMLTLGTGTTIFNSLPNSGFETYSNTNNVLSGTNSAVLYGSNSLDSITIPVPQDYSIAEDTLMYYHESEPQMPQKTFVVSGWCKTDSVATGYPGTNSYSKLMLKVTLSYYNTTFTSTYYFPFNDKVAEWQYITGIVQTEPDSNGFYHYLTSIDVTIVHDHNPTVAYFDDFALVEDIDGVVQYLYNSKGYCTHEIYSDGNVVEYAYATNGVDVASVTDENNQTSYSYTTNRSISAVNNVKTVGGVSKGTITEYTYNSNGKVTSEKIRNNSGTLLIDSSSRTYATQLAYFGQVATSTDRLGNVTTYFYNTKGQTTGVACNDIGTIYVYDSYGQLKSAKPAVLVDGVLEALNTNSTVSYTYNDKLLLSKISSSGAKYNFSYNSYNRLEEVRLGSTFETGSTIVKYTYDNQFGNLISEEYGNGLILTYTYDDLGNVTAMNGSVDSGISTVSFTYKYDNNGKLIECVDNTHSINYHYTYDNMGRAVQEQMYINGQSYSIVNNGYDDEGRLTSTYRYYADGVYPLTYTEYAYDDFDNISAINYGGAGVKNIYSYDDIERISNKVLQNSSGSKKYIDQTYYYSDRYPDYAMYETPVLEGISYSYINGKSQTVIISYDESERNIKKLQYKQNGSIYAETSYVYDSQGRLWIEAYYNENILTDEYDDTLELGQNPYAYGTHIYIYEYDVNGNRTSKKTYLYESGLCSARQVDSNSDGTVDILIEVGTNLYNRINAPLIDSLTYTYSGNRLTEITYGDNTYSSMGHDSLGNMTRNGSARHTWEGKQMLTFKASTASNATLYSYAYNDNGIRYQKSYGAYKQIYSLDGNNRVNRIAEYYNNVLSADVRFYFDAEGNPSAMRIMTLNSTGTSIVSDYTYYFVVSPLGDVLEILDSTGTTLIQYSYDAFGDSYRYKVVTNEASNLAYKYNPYLYRGYFYDTESGYYYLNSRYYDPELGRFLSMDDISYLTADGVDNANLYVYCRNNPIMYQDDSGNSLIFTMVAAGLVGAIFGGGADLLLQLMDNDGNIDDVNWGSVVNKTIIGGGLGLSFALGVTYLGPVIAAETVTSTMAANAAYAFAQATFISFSAGTMGYIAEQKINGAEYSVNEALACGIYSGVEGMYQFAGGGLTGSFGPRIGSMGSIFSGEWAKKTLASLLIKQSFSIPYRQCVGMLKECF